MSRTRILVGGSLAACLSLALFRWALPDRPQGRPGSAPEASTSLEPDVPSPLRSTGPLTSPIRTPQDLRAVVELCRSAGPAQASQLLCAARSSEDALAAGNAIRALGRLGLAGGALEVRDLLRDSRPRIRQEAVIALGRSGDPVAIDELQALLAGEDATLRRLALQALGRLGGSRARALVEEVARDARATDTDRAFARAALSQRGPEPTVARGPSAQRTPSLAPVPD